MRYLLASSVQIRGAIATNPRIVVCILIVQEGTRLVLILKQSGSCKIIVGRSTRER